MIAVIAVIIITAGLYRSARVPRARLYSLSLLSILALGLNNFLIFLDSSGKTDCGKYYDLDLGCSNVLPSWLVPFTAGLLISALALSVFILIKFRNDRRK